MIIIDTREAKLIDLFTTNNIEITVSNLAIGDVILKHSLEAETFEVIIERKCVQDMVASIKDGRYKEQKIRLLAEVNNASKERHIRISYLIEGTPAELRAPPDKTMLSGSIISSIFRDGIPTLRTYNLQETYDLLVRFHGRLIKDYQDFFPSKPISNILTNIISTATQPVTSSEGEGNGNGNGNNTILEGDIAHSSINYLASVKKNKKDNMTPAMWNINTLCGIPGVSNAIAIKIAERYPTIRSLLDVYHASPDDNSRECLLAEIILTETDKQRRRIGNVVSKRVYEYFYHH
jgi:crossover junction endonuclease MUS81